MQPSDKSELRAPLQERVETSLQRYMAEKKHRQRDPFGISLALFLLGVAGLAIWMYLKNGGWWWTSLILAAPCALFGVVGFVTSVVKVERDAAGHKIESPAAEVES